LRPTSIKHYDYPAQFEPLMPGAAKLAGLVEQSRPVVAEALALQGALAIDARAELQELVRAMNSYYSNRIEGQSTHPLNIEKALKSDFSKRPDVARRQRIAVAHIDAEKELEALQLQEAQTFSSETLRLAHAGLYRRMKEPDRLTDAGHVVAPGVWRDRGVMVHRHEPPIASAIPVFLKRTDEVYCRTWGLEKLLTAAACAHHRLIWVHPFLDGNGRACRLQLHAILHSLTGGLWSANRGLARKRQDYYCRLSEADMGRHGDLDGRGNLSEKMLEAWCSFFIAVCQDQVTFMTQLLAPETLKGRLAALIRVRAAERPGSDYREEAILPLLHVMGLGAVSRGDFIQMTGLGTSTARKVLSQLLADGLLKSESHKGAVRIAFPLDALNILFPHLYPEAAAVGE
jgi:Fic family protein